ncbi:MAG: transglutaminase [Bradymonadaceae bacterium]|nr:transglutaminase [Lujinxingiaceae bacterium]
MAKVMRFSGVVLLVSLKVLVSLAALSVPVMGVWFASSLAAFFNGPIWLTVACGLLFFPVLPLLWDLWATQRFHRKVANCPPQRKPPERILMFWDRLVVRTLVINLALLTTLALAFPERGFMALSTRGDWMLTEAEGGWVEPTRKVLFAAAGGLEWLYKLSLDNPYSEFADSETKAPTSDEGGELKTVIPDVVEPKDEQPKDKKTEDKDVEPKQAPARQAMTWPPPTGLHPLVVNMPPEAEQSIESVAKYILENEPEGLWRVKALYDYVADRIVYDVAALTGHRPSQDAETVFRTRMGVCAGYAQLLRALGEHTGDEIIYVVGVSRNLEGEVGGGGHAWNAARVDDKWYLLDPTWGSGHITDNAFKKAYNPAYLFTPPNVLLNTHFPDDEGWQLLGEPLSRGEFMRQPILGATFFANGMRLLDPSRSQITVGKEATLSFENPRARFLMASASLKGQSQREDCEVVQGPTPTVRCAFKAPGTYQVTFFGNTERYGSYEFWGRIEVNGG